MRILGFSGAQLVGRTTLVNNLSNRLNEKGYRTVVVPDTLKEVLAEWAIDYDEVIENYDLKYELYRTAVERSIKYHYEYMNSNDIDIILVDRTIFDYAVLATIQFKIDFTMKVFSRVNIDDIYYDAIFLVAPNPDINHKYPIEHTINQWHVHRLFGELLHISYYIPPNRPENMVDNVLNILIEDEIL